MSEYLSKKAVLEWLDDRRYKSPWIESFRERLEAGAFDADESEGTWKATAEILARENEQMSGEIQRLRAALEEIKVFIIDRTQWPYEGVVRNQFELLLHKLEALSTTSEQAERVKIPHIDITDLPYTRHYCGNHNCPVCGINAAEGDGNDA